MVVFLNLFQDLNSGKDADHEVATINTCCCKMNDECTIWVQIKTSSAIFFALLSLFYQKAATQMFLAVLGGKKIQII
ncbi:hypothetical protein DU508_06540 [Pedobacter chinensis]|uniref:Uncharacterized protein n=1 Tax=Pedobacter chinensis TaxID=2282421 RepID=A0A369Q077_9SPHI|nr:hypothetical protein DU508_06540 [Pedobacter chinensis]